MKQFSMLLMMLFVGFADAAALRSDVDGATIANPDHRHVAASALILKSSGSIDDETIPSNEISTPSVTVPENIITDTVVAPIELPTVPV